MSAEPRAAWLPARDLCLFAGVAALLLAGVYHWTAPRIAEQQRRLEQQALQEIAPPGLASIQAQQLLVNAPALGHSAPASAWQLLDEHGEVAAVVLPVRAPDGYNGAIDMLMGLDRQLRISGVRVTEHRETPGLADGIERRRSDWIEQYDGRSLGDPDFEQWTVQREGGEFDQLTGATVTPRAISRALGRALQWAQAEQAMLFDPQSGREETP